MPVTPPTDSAAVVADMVAFGARLEVLEITDRTMADPWFDPWYVADGWRWVGLIWDKRIPLMGLYLIRRAAQVRPEWA